MKGIYFILCIFLFDYTFANEDLLTTNMKKFKIVPDVIDSQPQEVLQINYKSDIKANLGNELAPKQVQYIPEVDWNAEENSLYTLLMTDPDAPGKNKEFRHWLVVNIPGKDVSRGKVVYEYVGAGPPNGTGLHRYIFLVFKQPDAIATDTFVPNNSSKGRSATRTRDLVKEYNLGSPVAGNFFRAQYDDYVPTLHAQLREGATKSK